jgi:carnitine O-acetyltransferase
MRVFGLTPAAANGFGIGYIIKDDTTEFCIISQYRQGDRLLSTLEWVLHQINHIWKHHIGKKRIPHAHELDNLKGLKNTYKTDASMVESQAMSRTTTVGSCEEEADIALGGYGYFDIEDLTLRSVQHSTVQTPVLSTSNSYADLLDVATVKLDKNFGKKIINNEKLKESFENHESSESENDLEDSKVVLNRFDAKFDRGQVGKKVDVGEIL